MKPLTADIATKLHQRKTVEMFAPQGSLQARMKFLKSMFLKKRQSDFSNVHVIHHKLRCLLCCLRSKQN